MSPRSLRAALAVLVSLLCLCWASVAAAIGNAWHIPSNAEPGIPTMRQPAVDATAQDGIDLYSGNQFQGAGNPGNQLQNGSVVFHRVSGAVGWAQAQLVFHSESGNNKYFVATIPAGSYGAGDVVEYYFRIAYSDQVTTYLHGHDEQSLATGSEATAQAAPFRLEIAHPLAPSGSYLSTSQGALEARVYEDSGHVTLSGPSRDGGRQSVALAPARIQLDGVWRYLGAVTASSPLSDGLALTHAVASSSVEAELRFVGEGVLRYEVVGWGGLQPSKTAAMGASWEGEHFYGFGEKFNSVDQTGNTVRVLTADPPGDKGDQSYKVMPWFVSTRGYGFHLDSSAESRFAMRSTQVDRFVATNHFSSLAYHMIYGPELTTVLERYTGQTGRPPLPPAWAFAPWMSSDHWRTGGEVRYVVTRLRELDIPMSVFVFDSPWEVAYNDFTWNETQFAAGGSYEGRSWDGFATAGEMLAFLKEQGFKVVLWMTPFVNVSSYDEGVPGQNTGKAANYDAAAQSGYFVRDGAGGPPLVVTWWKGDGSPVDFTNAAARDWLTSQLQALVDAGGGAIGGFKTDDGEGDFIPLTASYADGRTGVEMKNAYNVLYHQTVHGVLGDQGILFARSGFTGSQAYPACWAGDNEPNFGAENGLRSVIVAGLSAAMSGYSIWGHDIGGYQETNPSATPENLFMRWTQLGAFSPIMQMHRQVQLDMHYPWSYGAAGLENFQRYARLHTKLFPYLYSYAKRASETGLPILRPLVLLDPDDANTYGIAHTFRFGDEILVAPMIENEQTSRSVYLPAGGWYDWWTDARHEGGQSITWSDSDQMRLPLFVREGAIVPLLLEGADSLVDPGYASDPVATASSALEVLIYPAADTRFEVYDGTILESSADEDSVTLTSAERTFLLSVLHEEPPGVWLDGAALEQSGTVEDLDALESGYAYSGGRVQVKLLHAGGTSVVSFSGPGGPSGAGGGAGTTGGGAAPTAEDDGCGCRTAGRPARSLALAALLLLSAAALRRRMGRR